MSIMQALMMGTSGAIGVTSITGKLFGVGVNTTYGALGVGDTTSKSSPTQVGALTTWTNKFSAAEGTVLAIKSDGTLWAWGRGDSGQLGDGTTVSKSSPVQIGALSDWAQVCTAGDHSGAVKTDGTLWMWGANGTGRLGDGTTTARSSPVQIGALSDWASVYLAPSVSFAMKTDGTLWAWGENDEGVLGQGNTTDASSPVQIGAETDFLGYITDRTLRSLYVIRSA